jgi:hypothetical protein
MIFHHQYQGGLLPHGCPHSCHHSHRRSSARSADGGRTLMDLRISGSRMVEGWHGVPYGKPLGRAGEDLMIVRIILARVQSLEHLPEHCGLLGKGGTDMRIAAALDIPSRAGHYSNLSRRHRPEECGARGPGRFLGWADDTGGSRGPVCAGRRGGSMRSQGADRGMPRGVVPFQRNHPDLCHDQSADGAHYGRVGRLISGDSCDESDECRQK